MTQVPSNLPSRAVRDALKHTQAATSTSSSAPYGPPCNARAVFWGTSFSFARAPRRFGGARETQVRILFTFEVDEKISSTLVEPTPTTLPWRSTVISSGVPLAWPCFGFLSDVASPTKTAPP